MNGLGVLARLAVRRSRWFWLVWVLALAVVMPVTAAAYEQFVPPGPQGAAVLSALAGNPTMQAMLGPAVSLGEPGGFTVWRTGTFAATLAGVMAVLGVVRTTRGDEEEGRTELLRSGTVGRHAPLAATVGVALGAGCLLGLLVTVGMVAVGTAVAGSVAFGAGMAGTTAVFVGVAAVAAQLTSSARAARGIGLAVLGLAYLVRAVADGTPESSPLTRLRWLSPVEWMALSHPYAGERWWVLALPVLLTALLLGLAVLLESRRDHGTGLWPSRPGPPEGAASLSGPGGLAVRLHRGSVLGWTVGVSVFTLGMGTVSTSFDEVLAEAPELAEVMRQLGAGAEEISEAFIVALLGLLALVVAALGVQLLSRLRQEESAGRAEVVLATSASRTSLVLSHLLPALLVPSLLLTWGAVLLSLPQGLDQGDAGVVGGAVSGALVLLPGVWLTVGIAMALHGWAPAAYALVWLVLGWSLVVSWLGAVLGLPDWLTGLTPFSWLPALPVEPLAWTPVLVGSLLAVGLLAAGHVGYRARDLRTG